MSQALTAERPLAAALAEKDTLRHGPSLLPKEPKSEAEEKTAADAANDAKAQRPLPPLRSFGRRSLSAAADDTVADNDASVGIADTLRGTLDAFRRRITGPFPAESPHVASKNVIIGLTVAAFGVLALALTVYFSTGSSSTHPSQQKPAYAQPLEPLPAPVLAAPAPKVVAPAPTPTPAAPVKAVAPVAQPVAAQPAPKLATPKVTAPQVQAPVKAVAPVAQPADMPEMPDIPGIREAVAPQVAAPQAPAAVAPAQAAPVAAPQQPVAVTPPAAPQAVKTQETHATAPAAPAAPAMALPATTAPKKPSLDERGLLDILKKQ